MNSQKSWSFVVLVLAFMLESQGAPAEPVKLEKKSDLETASSERYARRPASVYGVPSSTDWLGYNNQNGYNPYSYQGGYNGLSGVSDFGSGYNTLGTGYNNNGYNSNGYNNNGYNTGYSNYPSSNYPRYNQQDTNYDKGYGGYGGYSGNNGLLSYSGYNNPYYSGSNNLGHGYYNKYNNGGYNSGYPGGYKGGNVGYTGITPSLITGYRGYS